MTAVRRPGLLVPAALALLLVGGCGSSLATQPGSSSRTVVTTQNRPSSPFCDAVEASRTATQPFNGVGIGRSISDVGEVTANVRQANQQVTSLAPQEIRADFERVDQLVERQLALLEANGGDTLAVARDPGIAQDRADPEYQAASQRIRDYVRSTCT
ncbi:MULTISPECIES: hypothetical protein [Pseudonocardia]|jgi:hypothetical protein|uniref:Outer membrane protein n=1 Tax=Pseudonocardia alni subsp. carboxydivorans TaxID=415010 RepID=A0ABU9AEE8_PSEA5|nr:MULTISPECIES: hypothetical protein [Pseudonocardia]MCM3847811.1 hypothetical protein [Pseudonocardia sp. DR1-2]NWJ69820.1 hypothetical protein [Pseudonocardia pini]WFG45431.1 hypothetical protein PaSha_20500 [Pseudonocardia alni]